jgi:hypothetical protein
VPGDCAEQAAGAARTAAQGERRRLARDLHDSVTQTLISLQLTAQAAADLWDTQPTQARAALDTIRHLAAGATIRLRRALYYGAGGAPHRDDAARAHAAGFCRPWRDRRPAAR